MSVHTAQRQAHHMRKNQVNPPSVLGIVSSIFVPGKQRLEIKLPKHLELEVREAV